MPGQSRYDSPNTQAKHANTQSAIRHSGMLHRLYWHRQVNVVQHSLRRPPFRHQRQHNLVHWQNHRRAHLMGACTRPSHAHRRKDGLRSWPIHSHRYSWPWRHRRQRHKEHFRDGQLRLCNQTSFAIRQPKGGGLAKEGKRKKDESETKRAVSV